MDDEMNRLWGIWQLSFIVVPSAGIDLLDYWICNANDRKADGDKTVVREVQRGREMKEVEIRLRRKDGLG
jgi:hypothetical protein